MDADEEPLATPPEPDSVAAPSGEAPGLAYLAFQVGEDRFAVPMRAVHAIVRPCPLTPVPFVPTPVLGVFALRGQVVPLLDLALTLGRAPSPPLDEQARFLILEDEGRLRALQVTRSQELLRVEETQLVAVTGSSEWLGQACIQGHLQSEGQRLLVLDPGALAEVWGEETEVSAE